MLQENLLVLLTLLLVKPLLIIFVIALGSMLLRKKSAALQHFWLTLGMSALLILPALFMLLPEIEWQVLPALNQSSPMSSEVFTQVYSLLLLMNKPQWLMLATAIYLLGIFWLLFYLALGLLAVAVQTREAKQCGDYELVHLLEQLCNELGIARRVRLVLSDAVSSPQMWGLTKPVIMLPVDAPGWANERKLSVLLHELGHVARCDWATTLAVKICCALFWFLPPIWWMAKRLFHCAEVACDDFIYHLRSRYHSRNAVVTYAENLLAMAQCENGKSVRVAEPVLSMAGHSSLFYRIEAILDLRRQRQNATPEARQYWVLVLLVMLLPVASLQLMPIREILHAQILNVRFPAEKIQRDAETVVKEQVPIHWMNPETLRKLKQQLLGSKSPLLAIEKMTVTGTKDFFDGGDVELDSLVSPTFNYPEPVIRIQGYMPRESVIPLYPRTALHNGIEGEVTVKFSIAQDGSINEPHILHSQPEKIFDKAVLTALQRSRYAPQIIDGDPVVLHGVIETFTFEIDPSPVAPSRRR